MVGHADRKTLTLGQIGKVVTGTTPPSSDPEQFGSEYPFITPSDITDGDRTVATERFLSNKGADRQRRRMLPAGAVCFTCIGATIGKVCMTSRPSFTNQQINSIIVDPDVADPYYVYCLLRFDGDRIKSRASGAATPIINKSAFSDVEVELPPLREQRHVSAILSAYDDLIENNTRRIAILEEMAQAIYREWFVHFRFPGHEQMEMVESELGPIPAGWEVVPVSAVAARVKSNIKPANHRDETFAHYSIPAFDAGRLPVLERGAEISSTKYIVEPDAVLISKLNPRISRVWLPEPPAAHQSVCSTEFVVLKPVGVSRIFLFSLLRSEHFLSRMVARAGGTSTSHQRVKPEDLLNMPIVLPPPMQVEKFTQVVQPALELVGSLRRKNYNLRMTRDLLLPKLISGEIDVEALESEPVGAVA